LKPLSMREKRAFLKSENLKAPNGLSNLHLAGISAEEAERTLDVVIKKLSRALHYKHTGNVLPSEKSEIHVRWFTNAYTESFERDFADFRNLPACPAIVRNRRDLSDQFAYRYGLDPAHGLSAYLIDSGFRFLLWLSWRKMALNSETKPSPCAPLHPASPKRHASRRLLRFL
jgi:hypothetical protein